MSCNCPKDWRLEAIDLASGDRLSWLKFVSFQMEEVLNDIGTATVICNVNDVNVADVWPHLRAIAFTRISGGTASAQSPFAEMVGMVEQITPNSDGTLSIGLVSVEGYLNHRILPSGVSYPAVPQTQICSDLVNQAASNGINLDAVFETSAVNLTRTYLAADDPIIWPSIADILASQNGPEYYRQYGFDGTSWKTTLHFLDEIGEDRGSLNARRGLVTYSVNVDAGDHANWIRGRNDHTSYSNSTYSGSPYARFDKAIQWSDLTESGNVILARNVEGELARNYDPRALPDVTIADIGLASQYRIGDTVTLNMNLGALRYFGQARVLSRAWSVSADAPTTCTLSFVPPDSVRASTLILNAPKEQTPRGCC